MNDDSLRRHAPATLRNRDVILDILKDVLPKRGKVLEIGSGSGEHAVYFSSNLPGIEWQPTDIDPDSLASIQAWASSSLGIMLPALYLDVVDQRWPNVNPDAIFSANMIHISPFECSEGLLRGAGEQLSEKGLLILYGPFIREDCATAPSNLAFDRSLRQQNPAWGIRSLSDITDLASKNGLHLESLYEMPANNIIVVFRKNDRV